MYVIVKKYLVRILGPYPILLIDMHINKNRNWHPSTCIRRIVAVFISLLISCHVFLMKVNHCFTNVKKILVGRISQRNGSSWWLLVLYFNFVIIDRSNKVKLLSPGTIRYQPWFCKNFTKLNRLLRAIWYNYKTHCSMCLSKS